jgi:hypothetical protein
VLSPFRTTRLCPSPQAWGRESLSRSHLELINRGSKRGAKQSTVRKANVGVTHARKCSHRQSDCGGSTNSAANHEASDCAFLRNPFHCSRRPFAGSNHGLAGAQLRRDAGFAPSAAGPAFQAGPQLPQGACTEMSGPDATPPPGRASEHIGIPRTAVGVLPWTRSGRRTRARADAS